MEEDRIVCKHAEDNDNLHRVARGENSVDDLRQKIDQCTEIFSRSSAFGSSAYTHFRCHTVFTSASDRQRDRAPAWARGG